MDVGSVTVNGSAGDQILNIATHGINTITPGTGADQVTLGAGVDTVVIAVSDSTIAAPDVITQFELAHDKLDLPVAMPLTTGNAVATGNANLTLSTIANGVVVFAGSAAGNVTAEVTALLTAMGTHAYTAAFFDAATNSSWVVQGDGVTGVAGTDIVVKLAGIQVTDLSAIII